METFCIVCRGPIPEKRARRNAVTCCQEHADELNRIRLRSSRKTKCYACGRRSHPRWQEVAVLSPHEALTEDVRPSENARFTAGRG